MNKEEPILILSMKISRPSNFATTTSQEEPHPFVAVSGFPMNKAFFFYFKIRIKLKSQGFGKRLLGIPSYSLSRNRQCNRKAFQDAIRQLLNFACKSYR